MRAENNIVIYNDEIIIGVLKEGEEYNVPNSVQIFNGSINEFLQSHEGYEWEFEKVPQIITSRQLRLQWVLSGRTLDEVWGVIDQLPEHHKTIAQINWDYAGNFERNHELLISLAGVLGVTDEQLDQIFINGNRL